jgi:hypothetical protein
MLDIIFISYDEPNAEKNFRNLKARYPHAKRVHGVKGIANAHIAAAKKANTTFFYVVDGDAEILDTFKFDYKPTEYEAQYVHIWHAFNPATGLDYGYGGVKLFSRKFFSNVKSQLDFTTTLTKDIKIMDEIACITRFNSDPIRSFRGAFRETVKLYAQVHKENIPENEKREARSRLATWVDPLDSCDYRQFVAAGSAAGIAEAKIRAKETDLLYINDHDLMLSLLHDIYPEIDLKTNPLPSESHPMKHEFFFTTRIAGSLYDPFVLEQMQMSELRDAISDGQLLSKNWLIEVMSSLINDGKLEATKDKPLKIAILGGWIGTLALMINAWELPVKITSVDLDERSNRIAEKLNYDFDFTTMTMNMYDLNYSDFDVIINTSSEHIPDIPKWRSQIPAGKIIMVQNNDFDDGDGHVSTVKNSTTLRRILKLDEVLYEGTRAFPQYSRFMLIGRT